MRFSTKEQFIELINSIESDEIYTLNAKAQIKPVELEIMRECYRQNGGLDLFSEEEWIKIKEDVEYCDKTYLNIEAALKTLLIYQGLEMAKFLIVSGHDFAAQEFEEGNHNVESAFELAFESPDGECYASDKDDEEIVFTAFEYCYRAFLGIHS